MTKATVRLFSLFSLRHVILKQLLNSVVVYPASRGPSIAG